MKEVQYLLSKLKESNTISFPSERAEQELVKQIEYADKIAHLFASGNCFYFIMNFVDMKFDFISKSVFSVLGMTPQKATLQGLLNSWHPEDLETMSIKEPLIFEFLYNYVKPTDIPHYKVSYINRLKNFDGTYKKILHQSSTISVSNDNKIEKTFCVETDVSHLNIPMSNTITFLGINGRKSYICDDLKSFKPLEKRKINLTRRELQVVSLTSKGFSSKEIAEKLNVSVHTIYTHKRNIIRNHEYSNLTQLISDCIVNGLI